jgi:hypothetical protein
MGKRNPYLNPVTSQTARVAGVLLLVAAAAVMGAVIWHARTLTILDGQVVPWSEAT